MVPINWYVWLWWMLASTVGWAVGGYAGVGLSSGIIVGGYVGMAAGGIVAGLLQWLVLRRQVAQAGLWAPASILAVAVVGVVVFAVGLVNTDLGWVVGAGAYGTVLGALQWLALRRQVDRAGWWVLGSTVGWVVGGPLGGIGGWVAFGAVYGAITGLVLVWLLRRPALEVKADE